MFPGVNIMVTQTSEMERVVDILLVEDNPADVLLMQEALQDGKLLNNLYVTSNGDEALDFLHRRGAYADAPRPDRHADLNLPKRTDGSARRDQE
jgi:CheY-like chemotaxis protein